MKKKNTNGPVKIHSVKFNLVMNIILKMSQYIFPLITTPYITRVLGTTANGKLAFASSVISYFSMFAQLGIPTYGIRECAKCRDDREKLTKTVQEILVINIVSVIMTYAALVVCICCVPRFREESILLYIFSITIFLNAIGMEWLYQAVEQYQYITARNIAFKLASIILMFLFIHTSNDYIRYAGLMIFSSCGSYVLNLINSKRIVEKKTYLGQYEFRKHLKPIFTFFALSVAVSVYTSMDTVMLGFLSNDVEVAYYALATKVKLILATSVSALGPVLLPRISWCIQNGRKEEYQNYIEKSVHIVVMASIPIVIYFTCMAPRVIDILGGREYIPATFCMRIITLAVIPLGIGNIATTQILTPMGKEKLTMYSTICGAIVNFFGNIYLIQKMGAAGAAVATVLAELIVAGVQVYFVRSEVKDIFKKLPYKEFVVSNIMATLSLCIFLKVESIESSIIVLLISCILFFLIYGLGVFIYKDKLVYSYITHRQKDIKGQNSINM